MAFRYPYTNLHELNLDWILEEVKKVQDFDERVTRVENREILTDEELDSVKAAIAPTFNASTAYAIGAYVWHNDNLYRFDSVHYTGAWNASEVTQVTNTNELRFAIQSIAPRFNQETENLPGSYVFYSNALYKLENGHAANQTWANTPKTYVQISTELEALASADDDLADSIVALGSDVNDLKSAISSKTRNLISFENVPESTISGVACSLADNILKAKGTATGQVNFAAPFDKTVALENGEKYVISVDSPMVGHTVALFLHHTDNSYQNLGSINIGDRSLIFTNAKTTPADWVLLRIAVNAVVDMTTHIQIQKGTMYSNYLPTVTATDYLSRQMALGDFVHGAFLGYASYLGNAIPMVFRNGTTLMIDSFSASAWTSVKADLARLGIVHLDYFMLTHWHDDHCGNVLNLISEGYIDSKTVVILPQPLDTSATGSLPPDWSTVVTNESTITSALSGAGITPIRPTEGQKIDIDGCTLEFWNADHSVYYPGQSYASTNYNDWSLCAYLKTGTCEICFTGDIGPTGQAYMVSLGTMRKADVMTAPHHGWTNGSYANGFGLREEFINAVHPDIVVTEDYSGNNSYYGTVTTPIQYWCEDNGIGNYRTYINGSIFFNVGGDGWNFTKGCKAYLTPPARWNLYNHVKEMFIDAQIKFTSSTYTNKYFASTSGAGVLHSAINAIVGTDGNNKYDFRIRVLDSSSSDSYLEALLIGYKYNTSAPAYEIIRNNNILISAVNQVGTVAFSGIDGTAQIVVEIIKEYS